MKKRIAFICCWVALGVGTQADETAGTSPYDPRFIQQLQQNDAFDLDACQLAKARAVSPEVQNFAATEWQSRSQDMARLNLLVEAKGLPRSSVTNGLWKQLLDKLNGRSGPEFDFTFLSDLLFVRLSNNSLAMLETKRGQDEELRALAKKIYSSELQDEGTITRLMGEAKRSGATVSDSLMTVH